MSMVSPCHKSIGIFVLMFSYPEPKQVFLSGACTPLPPGPGASHPSGVSLADHWVWWGGGDWRPPVGMLLS